MNVWKKLMAAVLTGVMLLSCGLCAQAEEGFAFNWDSDTNQGPHCKSIFMLNLDTDTVVYTHNPDEPLPMASMTKIMTYIVAYENIPDLENTVITVPQSVETELLGTGSSLAGVQVGEELTAHTLLYLMMVPSGNDAALTLMKYVDEQYALGNIQPQESAPPEEDTQEEGSQSESSQEESSQIESSQEESSSQGAGGEGTSQEGTGGSDGEGDFSQTGGQDPTDYTGSYFIQQMNEKAAELGCTNTHFTNPHGLHNDNHYASARDMAAITTYAMTLPYFTEICGTTAYIKPETNLSEETTIGTTNRLLLNYEQNDGVNYYYQSCTGIKTGSLDESGYCITASATAYGYTYVVVAMGAPMYNADGSTALHTEMLDVRSLFRWAVTSLERKTVAAQGDVLSSVKLDYAFQQDELQLVAGENASVMLPDSVDESSIIVTTDVPDSVEAPVAKGEKVGTATLSYADQVLCTVPLVAAESVAKSELVAGWQQGKELLTSPWFLVILAVVAALIIVYVILIVFYRRKQRKLRRVRRRRDL